jgi:cobalt transporter subunit CbtB
METLLSQTRASETGRAVLPAVVAFVLGVFILAGVGFAGASVLHNAAHDSRHSFAFPCH